MVRYYELDKRGISSGGHRPDTLGYTPSLIIAYGAISIIVAVIIVMMSLTGVNVSDGSSLTQDEMNATLTWWPIAAIIGGLSSVFAGMWTKEQKNYVRCLFLLAVADVAVFLYSVPAVQMFVISFILLIIGIVMTYRVYQNRNSFTDRLWKKCTDGIYIPRINLPEFVRRASVN